MAALNDENKKPEVMMAGGKVPALGLSARTALGNVTNSLAVSSRDGKTSKIGDSKIPKPQTARAGHVPAVPADAASSFSARMYHAMEAEPTTECRMVDAVRNEIQRIDNNDRRDPQAVADYVNDIFLYLKELEIKEAVPSNYMVAQSDINEKMRAILIDWLVEVHLKFKLVPETLYLTCNIIDRYLSQKSVTRQRLQLVGVTAMLIASKFEEIYAPEVRDFVYISDKAYTRDEILEMEGSILGTLNFNLSVPTALMFLPRFYKLANVLDMETQYLVHYFLELTLQDYKFLKYIPSLIASSALYLGLKYKRHMNPWSNTLQYYTGYSEAALRNCAKEMEDVAKAAPTRSLTAVYKKYSGAKFNEVAKIVAAGVESS
eukprot:tig00000769_g4035.t1